MPIARGLCPAPIRPARRALAAVALRHAARSYAKPAKRIHPANIRAAGRQQHDISFSAYIREEIGVDLALASKPPAYRHAAARNDG